MEEIKLTVTQEKRQETIEKILQLVETDFKGIDVTAIFTKVLLQEAIRTVEDRAMLAPLNVINHTLNNRE
ncbi:hypothetical protein DP144_02040 [Clostridium tetani]|uniref:hypothetical protein n=1 Tax=Clostridium tetani TaxID=1513 RepID=UPI00100B5C81|nr:hypothetical protein [Clostridium tetani]RXM79611.1 hypothetical protein DP154_02035 [Clostridium tetani]RYV00425.1 hypothetical protein DP144_02040 [Clostridium tetani]